MSRIYRIAIAVVALFAASFDVVAQSDTPAEGNDLHRTRLVCYATDAEARERQMTKQRYQQPIVEWADGGEGVLVGEFTYPFSWVERQIFLRVEGAGQPYEVWINGRYAGGSSNGFAAAEFNITKLSREDKNRVELRMLASSSVDAIECFERGDVRPVAYVISQPRVRVRDIFWRTTLGKGTTVNADFGVIMHNQTLGAKSSRIYYELMLNDTIRLAGGHRDVALGMYGVDTMRFGAPVADSLLWSAAKPHHITLHLKNRIAGRDVEFYALPVALRELRYSDGRFFINGVEESVVWREMSPTSSLADLERLYTEGCRAIRFTAGYVADELLDYCDMHGVYVALTAPINSSKAGLSRRRGGNPSNNPSWVADYVERAEQLVHTAKRHPSVVAYYLADDSANGIALYESYLAMKRVAGDRPVFYDDGGREWNTDAR